MSAGQISQGGGGGGGTCGSEGSGEQSRDWTLSSAVLMVRAGDHWSFRMSRQIAPVCEETFGCHTRQEEGGGRGRREVVLARK
jgi:hypothetical protein